MLTTDASNTLNSLLELGFLTDLQNTVLRQAWEGKTYPAIAQDLGYDAGYIRDVGAKLWRSLSDTLNLEINKTNFRSQIQRYFQTATQGQSKPLTGSSPAKSQPHPAPIAPAFPLQPSAPAFYGREAEQQELTHWIEDQQCRLVAILGMGGIGKTALAEHLVNTLQPNFKRVIWRSLHNAPPVREVLADLLGEIGHLDDEIRWEDNLEHSLTLLLSYLKQDRCLLILDNLETVLRSHERTGDYREGYEEYELLFARVAQLPHQSCLMLTSREKPKALLMHQERSHQVRFTTLKGLDTDTIQKLLSTYQFSVDDINDWDYVVNHYAGNPLALKLISSTVRGLFDGDLAEFRKLLSQGIAVSDDVDDLLEQQFRRLSAHEKELIYWIASQREALTYGQLNQLLLTAIGRTELPRSLERLKCRSLLEEDQGRFTLQPMIAEYAIAQLTQALCDEITNAAPNYLNRLALVNTQLADHIRSAQIRQLLQPLIDRLTECLSKQDLEYQIEQIKVKLREDAIAAGYAAGNLWNLLRLMNVDLRDRDFSHLTLWHADLAGLPLQGLNLRGCTFANSVFSETFGSILCVALNPAGTLVAAGTTSNDIYIWKASGANSVAVLRGHQNWIRSIAFSADGQWLASASQDHTVRLWHLATGECQFSLSTGASAAWAVVFSPDSQLLVSGSDDQALRVWNVGTGRCQQIHDRAHDAGIASLSLTLDGTQLISTGKDHQVKIWAFPSLSLLGTLTGHQGSVWCAQISPDGLMLATGSDDCTVRLWDLQTHQCLSVLEGHTRCVWTVSFSPDGQYLVSGGHDHSMRLWDTSTQRCLRLIRGHTSFVWSVVFSHDGKFLISGGHDQTLRWWQFPEGRPWKNLQGYSNGIQTIAASTQNPWLISGGRDPNLRFWQAETGELLRTLSPHSGWIQSLALSPNERWLASASEDLSIDICCTQTGQSLHTLTGHGCWIWSIAFSPDASLIVSASEDTTVRLWSLGSGQCLGILRGHTHSVRSVAFSADQRCLASGSLDGTVRIWDLQSQQLLQTLQTDRVHTVTWSADGQYLAYGEDTGQIRVWHASTQDWMLGSVQLRQMAVLPGHSQRISCLRFSPDSQLLLSGSDDRTAKLWQVQNQTCLQTLSGHLDAVTSVAFGLNPLQAMTGSLDATLRVWSIREGKVLQEMRVVNPYEGMNIRSVSGLSETRQAKLRILGAVSNIT